MDLGANKHFDVWTVIPIHKLRQPHFVSSWCCHISSTHLPARWHWYCLVEVLVIFSSVNPSAFSAASFSLSLVFAGRFHSFNFSWADNTWSAARAQARSWYLTYLFNFCTTYSCRWQLCVLWDKTRHQDYIYICTGMLVHTFYAGKKIVFYPLFLSHKCIRCKCKASSRVCNVLL